MAADEAPQAEDYPGRALGYPEHGAGSIATFRRRLAGLVIDWGLCLVVSAAFFPAAPLATLAIFVAEQTLLVGTVGGAVGHRLAGIVVTTLDGHLPGIGRAAVRACLLGLVIPALVFTEDSRAGHDVLSGTVARRR